MPPSGVDYASEFLNGYAPEYVIITKKEVSILLGISLIIIIISAYLESYVSMSIQ